mmetsp:Transcript_20456/g.55826  ORF Transcript_20456/g.55826 Transcript_20456/m.55826 type:complete len:524 (-) Transcript_20456:235-1806(-)
MVRITVDAPASSWGLIIGKGGQTLKTLEAEHQVKIKIPRPQEPGDVTVTGAPANCESCRDAILAIVNKNSRGKEKKRVSQKNPKGSALYPSACLLCDSKLDGGVPQLFQHFGSDRHQERMVARDPALTPLVEYREKPDGTQVPKSRGVAGVVTLLRDDAGRRLHTELGFDVDALLALAAQEQARQDALQALANAAARLSADPDWFHVEERATIHWDESPAASGQTLALKTAPMLDDMASRVNADARPPMIRAPRQLPVALPRMDPAKRRANMQKALHRYPAEPGSGRLGIVAAQALGWELGSFDVVCGTSLVKALSGDTRLMKDEFFLQRFQGTVCCLHMPSNVHGQDDVGHAVERLLCGASDVMVGGCDYMATAARVGESRMLIMSEVDATDSTGMVVELKSSNVKGGKSFVTDKVALQVMVNGSGYVLACSLDEDKARLIGLEWIPVGEGIANHRSSITTAGQRVRLLLEQVLAYMHDVHSTAGGSELGPIVKLTFDDGKAPVLEVTAESGVEVLPLGMPL